MSCKNGDCKSIPCDSIPIQAKGPSNGCKVSILEWSIIGRSLCGVVA